MTPRTYLVGVTQPDHQGIESYLIDTGQEEFLQEFIDAHAALGPICLCSMFAKMCYKSLVSGKNANVKKIRGIEDNIKGCFDTGHGSVFEHVNLNFITTDCSRVFTHELVRHRVGTAFSQTSGRYVSVEDAELVLPDEMEEHSVLVDGILHTFHEAFEHELERIKRLIVRCREELDLDSKSMAAKKWWTSQLRRLMPNGQNNEIAWSVNIRSLRHIIEMRTSRHAEWEIRVVFNNVAELVRDRWPLMLYGEIIQSFDGLNEITGLKV